VLYHLCNPDAPKFLTTCTNCLKEILSGNRFHCNVCADFDLCQDCYQRVSHPHELKPVPVKGSNPQQNQTPQTEAQRRERQRSIQLHMQLLGHASECKDARCPSVNCSRMKVRDANS
jgi:E1A/CREB-binding protein